MSAWLRAVEKGETMERSEAEREAGALGSDLGAEDLNEILEKARQYLVENEGKVLAVVPMGIIPAQGSAEFLRFQKIRPVWAARLPVRVAIETDRGLVIGEKGDFLVAPEDFSKAWPVPADEFEETHVPSSYPGDLASGMRDWLGAFQKTEAVNERGDKLISGAMVHHLEAFLEQAVGVLDGKG